MTVKEVLRVESGMDAEKKKERIFFGLICFDGLFPLILHVIILFNGPAVMALLGFNPRDYLYPLNLRNFTLGLFIAFILSMGISILGLVMLGLSLAGKLGNAPIRKKPVTLGHVIGVCCMGIIGLVAFFFLVIYYQQIVAIVFAPVFLCFAGSIVGYDAFLYITDRKNK